LVADADRLLTGGSKTKAKELYQRALRVRPGGFKAICGLGFVALDHGQIPVAYEYFKRALAAKASYPPALFGLAEIHRARGEKTLALQSYKHYLQIMPNGSEARAARRQVEALQASR
jgi:tetratricopeptide (TPR) repeat protein